MDKRIPNYTTEEENDLLSIVKKYKNIVECKKTDTLANAEKYTIWVTIAKEFNASAATTRSAVALKAKYKNIKRRKQKFADEKYNIKGTRGGPAKIVQVDSSDMQVLELQGQRMTSQVSEFDHGSKNDTNINALENTTDTQTFMHEFENNVESDLEVQLTIENSDESSATDCPSYTTAKLKTPVSTPLESKRMLSSNLCDWVKSESSISDVDMKLRLEKLEKQMLFINEEHKLKMLHMHEQHAKDMQMKDEQHAMQMQILNQMLSIKDEHELKMLHMQEQHAKDIQMKDEQHAKDIQLKDEQHAMQMQILKQMLFNKEHEPKMLHMQEQHAKYIQIKEEQHAIDTNIKTTLNSKQ